MGGFEGLPLQPEGEGQIIQLPEDSVRVEALRAKLEEYRERLGQERYRAQDMQQHMTYRIAILEALLENGNVDTSDLSRRLESEHEDFNPDIFGSCCRIIGDYARTGGKETHGGTGLGKK